MPAPTPAACSALPAPFRPVAVARGKRPEPRARPHCTPTPEAVYFPLREMQTPGQTVSRPSSATFIARGYSWTPLSPAFQFRNFFSIRTPSGSHASAPRSIASPVPGCSRNNHDPGHAASPRAGEPRRSFLVLAQARLYQLRRPHRADRHHAPGPGGETALDLGEALPACAQLLHAAARPRGHAARHLHRLDDAPDLGRHHRRRAVRAALH